jgi:hypothetical protein
MLRLIYDADWISEFYMTEKELKKSINSELISINLPDLQKQFRGKILGRIPLLIAKITEEKGEDVVSAVMNVENLVKSHFNLGLQISSAQSIIF